MVEGNVGDERDVYQITVEGRLEAGWSEWLSGMSVAVEADAGRAVTQISGAVADQAALRGLLNRLWDLNLVLVSVVRLVPVV